MEEQREEEFDLEIKKMKVLMANREGDDTVERHGSTAEQGVGHRVFADAGKG